jgi:putative tryptophan/tyrosine transport system substrate-binding protein
MRRRDFITFLGGAAATWPLAARAQQANRVQRIGVLTQYSEGEPDGARYIAAFRQKIRQLGWVEGYNLAIEYRWAAGRRDLYPKLAAELVAAQPDVLITSVGAALGPLLEVTRTIPIVFTSILDPVGNGFIESLARPGGNATGFVQFEWSIASKWLDLLRQMAPRMTRVAVLRDPSGSGGAGQLGAVQAAASTLGIEVRPIDLRDPAGVERAIADFAQQPNGGLIETAAASAALSRSRSTVITLAARHKLPTIFPLRYYVADEGGLMSYGPDQVELWRLAAGYLARVLKGEKPSELAVQAPTKYELVINLKTAKALGLTVPPTLLVAADEVIE